jgi:hypothetical protein
MELDSLVMPELVTVEGVREELGREKSDMSRSAADVFSNREVPLKMLVPQGIGEKANVYKPMETADNKNMKVPIQTNEIGWYDEYMKQKREGKWGRDAERIRENELKNVLTDKAVESGSSGVGAGARAPRMKPTSYDGLTPYEDHRVQFHMVAELNGWDKKAKALYLAGCLSKGARSVLNDMIHEDRYDYDKLDEALRERYGTEDQAELFKAKLRSRV